MTAGDLSGVGIGLRKEFHKELLATSRHIDFVEVIAENFMGLGGRADVILRQYAERWPIVVHGVALSVGGPDPLGEYLTALRPLLDRVRAPFFSDHLCYSSLEGEQTFDLLPLPFHEGAVAHVAKRVRETQERLERPMLLENITYYAQMPGSLMPEVEFVAAVVDRAACGLLLDLNNLYVNARNHAEDPFELLKAMPLHSVRQIHLAGFTNEGDVLLDTHSRPVSDPVWELYRWLVERLGPVPTLIEWDQAIPSLDRVLDEADRARAIQRNVAKMAPFYQEQVA